MSNLTLIQLISEQTIQNLLPILHLKPKRLIHLVTPKTAARAEHLRHAAHSAGIDPSVEVINLSSMPAIPECFNAVRDCLEKLPPDQEAVINFTGGTKLMSIGAYAVAMQRKIPSFYVDTQNACFMDGGTSSKMGEILTDDWSFTPLRNQLRVDTLAVANGVARVTSGKAWKPLLPLARLLFENRGDEESIHAAFHGPHGLFPAGREPRTPADWLPFFEKHIQMPGQIAALAAAAGFLRRISDTDYALPDASRKELDFLIHNRVANYTERYFAAIAPVQHAVAFLTGGWWEVIVMDALEKSGQMRDLRWSVQVGDRTGADVEEDVVALDGVEILYINCKRGGAKARLLPLLEEVRARAASLGGTFNRRFLAIYNPPSGKVDANLRQRARELGIKIITRLDVYKPGIFNR